MTDTPVARTAEPSDAELHAFGYAPGNYTSKCLDCDAEIWHVDKRCHVCRPCAVKRFQKPRELLTSNANNTLEVGHIADLWHVGTERFYRARVIAAITPQEAIASFEASEQLCTDEGCPHHGTPDVCREPAVSLIERLERYKRCCTEASEAYRLLTEAISTIERMERDDEVHWKTRRTLLRELAAFKGEDGPGEEDGPWAEGWEVRRGALETNARVPHYCTECGTPDGHHDWCTKKANDIQSRPLYTCTVAGCPGNHLSQGSVCKPESEEVGL